MARGVCPCVGGAPCAPVRAEVDPPDLQPRGVQCRDCAPVGCDGSCDLPPFTD
jgi:hypothetical protein